MMPETIMIGAIRMVFYQDKHGTKGGLDMFEMTVPADGQVPAPHYHRDWDETVLGLEGTLLFTLDGVEHPVGPGDTLFIPRGQVHGFQNRSGAVARNLGVLTPGVLGPEYFREIGALIARGKPDPAAIEAIMLRHGLVPADNS